MTLWLDSLKMAAFSAVLWLVLCVAVIAVLGVSEHSFLLFTPRPKWPVFVMMLVLWCVALKAAYWWVFQRLTFYVR